MLPSPVVNELSVGSSAVFRVANFVDFVLSGEDLDTYHRIEFDSESTEPVLSELPVGTYTCIAAGDYRWVVVLRKIFRKRGSEATYPNWPITYSFETPTLEELDRENVRRGGKAIWYTKAPSDSTQSAA